MLTHLPARFFWLLGQLWNVDFRLSRKLLRGRNYLQNAILWTMKIIDTTEAARRLNVTPTRVRAMINSGRLKATKIGIVWMIDPKHLEAVKDRKVGRPRKVLKTAKR